MLFPQLRIDPGPARRIAIGTAQFGMKYGINNRRGAVPATEVDAILERGCREGVDTIDTAHAYGHSENVIGAALAAFHGRFRVITKLGAGMPARDSLRESLTRLRTSKVEGVLVHDYASFVRDPGLLDELIAAREAGIARKIGFSLYYPAELSRLLDEDIDFDLVQCPFSVFDRRFEPLFPWLKRRGVEIHVRSVFLQGLVFTPPRRLSPHFEGLRRNMVSLYEVAAESGLCIASVCLGFALSKEDIDRVVIGVDGSADFEENLSAVAERNLLVPFMGTLQSLSCDDERIVLPFNWKP